MSDNRTKEQDTSEVRIGDIWKEVDPRFTRFVRIVGRSEHFVRVYTCTEAGYRLRHRETACSIGRFNGKRGGYAFHARGAT
jgi:hypothetical protein